MERFPGNALRGSKCCTCWEGARTSCFPQLISPKSIINPQSHAFVYCTKSNTSDFFLGKTLRSSCSMCNLQIPTVQIMSCAVREDFAFGFGAAAKNNDRRRGSHRRGAYHRYPFVAAAALAPPPKELQSALCTYLSIVDALESCNLQRPEFSACSWDGIYLHTTRRSLLELDKPYWAARLKLLVPSLKYPYKPKEDKVTNYVLVYGMDSMISFINVHSTSNCT